MKEIFTTKPLLVAPDLDKKFRVEVDTSNFATGGVLSIKCVDDKWRPVAYIFKSLNETEHIYEIDDKEIVIKWQASWSIRDSGLFYFFSISLYYVII